MSNRSPEKIAPLTLRGAASESPLPSQALLVGEQLYFRPEPCRTLGRECSTWKREAEINDRGN